MRQRWAGACCAAVGVWSRSEPVDSAPPPVQRVHLAAGLAAKVGAEDIALSTVAGIARAQRLPLPAARDLAARDAAFAAGARVAFAGGPIVPVVERGAWARARPAADAAGRRRPA